MNEKYYSLSVSWISQKCTPYFDKELTKVPIFKHLEFEACIVAYQVVSHVMGHFYLYGVYIYHINLDLIIVCCLLLSRKILYKAWLSKTQ